MKIMPKYASGGGFGAFFTTYKPVQVSVPQTSTSRSTSNTDSVTVKDTSKKSSDDDKDDSKGKLTEKDLFNMIKDVDGLPNEMKSIIRNLQSTLETEKLAGVDTGQLANNYLNTLYKLKVANQNKKKYDEALATAKENGSLGEAAITLSGDLMVQDKDGNIKELSLEEYQANRNNYQILTNSNIAWLRKYSPNTAFTSNDNSFEIISNGMGYEAFQKLLSQGKLTLGNYKYEESGIAGKEALLGLKTLQGMSQEQKEKYLNEALDGKYSYTSSSDSNTQQIQSLISYLTATLPQRAKTWASIKTGITDSNKATEVLVAQYLSGEIKDDSKFEVKYMGTDDKLKRAGNSSSKDSSEPKKGFWQQLQTEQGGDTQTYNLLVGKGQMSVTGKYYGTTPGMEENTSLTKYISNSKVGYLIKNTRGITFGDQTLSIDSFDDVMVNTSGGALVTTLPINPDGTVNFDILNTYTNIESKLKAAGLKPGTNQYNKVKAQVLKKKGLGYLIDASNGQVNPKYFGHFLILEGVASNRTKTIKNNEVGNVELTDFVKDSSGNDQLFDTVRRALSDKDKGGYELDNNWFKFNNNKLYKGNIYIPLNQNALNAVNADENEVKVSQAQGYEHDMQRQEERQNNWEKAQRKQPTNADFI